LEVVFCALVEVGYGYAVCGGVGGVYYEIAVVGCCAVAE